MGRGIEQLVLHVASKYLKWHRHVSGNNLQGACPFHAESTEGAFYISLETGLFICHGCQAKGSLPTFLKWVGSPKALRQEAHEQLAKFTRFDQHTQRPEKINLTPISEALLGIFDFCPVDLVNAGFSPALLKEYDVGFDKMHMRITFPLRDHNGTLVGISGRTVINKHPRYLIYKRNMYEKFSERRFTKYDIDKKHLLWNFHNIQPAVYHGEYNSIIIVEGYKACLWMIQCGFPNTVALMGLHLSNTQRSLLQRFNVPLYIFLDNGTKAREATAATAEKLRRASRVSICEYPRYCDAGVQPDDLSEEEIQTIMQTAQPYAKWRMHYVKRTKHNEQRPELRAKLSPQTIAKITEFRERKRDQVVSVRPSFQTADRVPRHHSPNQRRLHRPKP